MTVKSQLLFLILITLIFAFSSLFLGVAEVPLQALTNGSQDAWFTVLTSRIPRLFSLILAGAGLAVCGVILQQVVQNKFAEPATTGGLDAAKLGVLIAVIQWPEFGIQGKALSALLFCLLTSSVFVLFLRQIRIKSTILVPVIGLMYGSVLSAIANFYAYQNNLMQNMQAWLLGDFSKVIQGNYEVLYFILPIVIIAYVFAQRFSIIGMGESVATSLGLNYFVMMSIALFIVSLCVATIMVTVGSLPFVGLVIPNLVAIRYGDNIQKTLPLSALFGALFLIICDIIGRLIIYPFEIPIGLTSGCIGGLLFLLILKKVKQQ
ncbi:ABC transporter permease [Pseudoalteromonas sp. JB197]|uniref:ABC transporter permease n=1 Tax=Pseudoalteromonas sp. JB197 TaxID=1434839 RepID=UPI00097F58B4|nr:iron chelate uptake ABC transporter family permease subunit [Pseudoalteromonas sp. JB197]PCC09892.1 iron ABC transporter permease [Pseudoalteromonas sp. JB197]SJN41047.1 Iron transport protein [Pseudoalteromonas sp. JB197]